MNIEELKRLAEVSYGWRGASSAWLHESNDGSAVVGNIDDSHDPAIRNPVAVVDVTQYDGFQDDSIELAQFYAAANPSAILELIRQRDELLVALEQERKRLDWALKKQAYCGRSPDRLWVDVGTGNHKWFAVHDGNPRATIDKLMAK